MSKRNYTWGAAGSLRVGDVIRMGPGAFADSVILGFAMATLPTDAGPWALIARPYIMVSESVDNVNPTPMTGVEIVECEVNRLDVYEVVGRTTILGAK